jgi:hypothetical protein
MRLAMPATKAAVYARDRPRRVLLTEDEHAIIARWLGREPACFISGEQHGMAPCGDRGA